MKIAMLKIRHKKRAKQNHSRAGDVCSVLILILMGSFMALPLVLGYQQFPEAPGGIVHISSQVPGEGSYPG